jgi:DNA-binding SARP family transcriptional activator
MRLTEKSWHLAGEGRPPTIPKGHQLALEFRILGPVEVRRDRRALDVGTCKQLGVLITLLLRANTVVAVDRLVDEVWGEAPPRSAAKAIQVYVSGLRKVLEPGRVSGVAAEMLLTRPPGYILRATTGACDAACFEALVAEARGALAGLNPIRAGRLLREALALWRGPALADVADEPFAHSEAIRLEEERLAAIEDRVEADLACARHSELVGELQALVGANPFRERLWGQLMLAMYRAGRQAEALRAYQQVRRVLADELGIEPGRALQQLEHAVVSQATELELAAAPRSPQAPRLWSPRTRSSPLLCTPARPSVSRRPTLASSGAPSSSNAHAASSTRSWPAAARCCSFPVTRESARAGSGPRCDDDS